MTFSIRMRRLFVFLVAFTMFAGSAAYAAKPDSGKVRQKVADCNQDCTIKLRLVDHSKIKGRIISISDDSVDVSTRDGKLPVTVPFSQIATASSRTSFKSSFSSRFKTGPCVDPITLAIASPFILVAAMLGR
jgi:hypothetical protein